MDRKKEKVLLALSGGMDSAAAAFILKKKGYDVSAVFMRFWKEKEDEGENKCCSAELKKKAKNISLRLKIPFYVFDFKKEFKKCVVDDFLKKHQQGLTPNPCVICNEKIKIGLLLKKARAAGFNFLATGHYARRRETKGKWRIFTAKDSIKDQSYFLYRLKPDEIKYLLFPLGGLLKSEIKKIIKKNSLPVRTDIESQEICFVPENDVFSFLKRKIRTKNGIIVDRSGKKLGDHLGLSLYTIGQRKGINISGGPYYVLNKNLDKNQLMVTKNKKDLYKKEFFVTPVSFFSGYRETNVFIKTRSGDKFIKGKVVFTKNKKVKVLLNKPAFAVTAGQSAVFYKSINKKEKEIIGGGIISKIF